MFRKTSHVPTQTWKVYKLKACIHYEIVSESKGTQANNLYGCNTNGVGGGGAAANTIFDATIQCISFYSFTLGYNVVMYTRF